jgi:hypothetical protein
VALYKWSTDPPGKPASHTISEADHIAHKKVTGFTPFVAPTKPPAGTYDPGLDASERANSRGLLDLQQDTDTGNQRADTQHTQTLAQLLQSRDRGLTDLSTALSRGSEQYDNQTFDLGLGYRKLGQAQTGAATRGGFVDTGTIAASGGARAANQGRDQGRLDVANQERIADNQLAQGRLNEDYTTAKTQADTEYQYGVDDRSTGLSRALREGNFFGQDTAAARMYQATSSGLYTPPTKPKNESSDAQGPYRLIIAHGLRYKMRPNGKREPAGVAGRG